MLIVDWRRAWRFLSVQLTVLLGLLFAAYDYWPVLQTLLPPGWQKWALPLIVIGRIVKQGLEQADERGQVAPEKGAGPLAGDQEAGRF